MRNYYRDWRTFCDRRSRDRSHLGGAVEDDSLT